MPTYKWKLRNKKYCTDCPLHYVHYPGDGRAKHICTVGYFNVWLRSIQEKTRPEKCRKELGE